MPCRSVKRCAQHTGPGNIDTMVESSPVNIHSNANQFYENPNKIPDIIPENSRQKSYTHPLVNALLEMFKTDFAHSYPPYVNSLGFTCFFRRLNAETGNILDW